MKSFKRGTIWALLALLGLIACSLNPLAESESKPILSPTTMPLTELTPRLEALWGQVDQGKPYKDNPPILWQPAYSPLFPSEWPPTPTTTWTRYAYAQGQDMSLADGVHIAKPWAQIQLDNTSSTATLVLLSQKLEPFGIQGVSPLDAEMRTLFDQGEQVSDYCLSLHQLPDPNTAEAALMRAFYQLWLKYNGTIASEIKPDHAAFFEWITS